MTEKEIIKMRGDLLARLDQLEISKAIAIASDMALAAGLKKDYADLKSVAETYRFMLHYLMQGATDDGRPRLLASIKEQLRQIADKAVREIKAVASPQYYYAQYRFNRLRPVQVSSLIAEYNSVDSELTLAEAAENPSDEIRQRKEAISDRLFSVLYTSLFADSDYDEVKKYILSDNADFALSAQAVSALTLGLLAYYDKAKFTTLLDIYEQTSSTPLAAKAMAGVILALHLHGQRVSDDSQLIARLSLWGDSIETFRHLRETIRAIVSARDTRRVAAKMKDEVIPELMKLRPDLLKSMDNLPVDGDLSAENNPEWEEMLEKSGLSEKLRELSEMQSDGADLMMVTFANLKQFPFFNNASRWFLPFDAAHTALHLNPEMRKVVEMLKEAGQMVCDSDMYSLALAVAAMPEKQRNMMTAQFPAQMEQMKEEMNSSMAKSSVPEFDREVVKSVRDLYRFFNLFRNKGGVTSPFDHPLEFQSLPGVGEIIDDVEVVRIIGEFYFKRGYYREALPLLKSLADDDVADAMLWEKIGFCYQNMRDYTEAERCYEKAALDSAAPSPWLVKKLAYVNKRLAHHDKAARYYEQALEMDPENEALMLNAGVELMQIDSNADALRHFYHILYNNPDAVKAIRAAAAAEFKSGNFDKSVSLYSRIFDKHPEEAEMSDWLAAGNAALVAGKIQDAADFYKRGAKDDFSSFELAFKTDLDALHEIGVDRTSALLMLDALRP